MKSFSNVPTIDEEGFFRTVEIWTKADGSIKLNVGDGFGKDNLLILLDTAIRCVEEGNYAEK